MQFGGRPWTVPVGSFSRPLPKDVPPANAAASGADGEFDAGSDVLGVSPSLLASNGGSSSAEVDELHRAYRIMELTRKQHSEESANTLRMQRQQIDKLKKDTDRLKEDLALETRQARQANNISGTAQIAKLQDQGDIYTRKIETEKRRLEELDKQIKRLQNAILLQRKEMGGVHATRDSNTGVQKSIRILENRLDKALVKFNEALAHNKSLRESIDNLRRERVVFDGIYHKLARELARKKAHMHSLMSEANRATEVRLAAQQEMVALKAAADKEQEHFEQEWKALGLLIDRDRRAKENAHKAADRERMMGSGGMRTGGGGDPAMEAEALLRRKVTKGAWGIATDKASIHLSMEKVQAYEEAFAAIQKATRITDIDALVSEFVTAEDANFSLFNYVNDLANEVEKVEEQQNQVKEQIARLRGARPAPAPGSSSAVVPAGADGAAAAAALSADQTDLERKKLLAELDDKLHKYATRARASEERFAASSATLQALKAGVGAIFTRLGCGSSLVKPSSSSDASQPQQQQVVLLGGDAGVTESNIMQYLGLIEARTNELLHAYARHRDDHGAADTQAATSGEELQRTQRADAASAYSSAAPTQRAGGADTLSIRAPSAGGSAFSNSGGGGGDGHDDEDEDGELAEDARPLSHEQLQQTARRQLQQQADGY
jgi:hypothetical protein